MASLSLGLGTGQVTGHLLLTWLGHGAASGPGGSAVAEHAMAALGPPSVTMVLMRVLAVGVLAYLLARGESVLWRVLNAVMPRMLQPTLRVRSVPVPAVNLPAPLHRHLLLVVPRRGPPVMAA